MRDLFIMEAAQRATGMILVTTVVELITNTNAACSKFPAPPFKSQGETPNGTATWFPIDISPRGKRDVVVGIPVLD